VGAPSARVLRRIGLPIAAALASAVIGAQGASAATAHPTHPVPPPCRQVTGGPHLSQSGGGVIVTQPAKPGRGHCVVCVVQIKGGGSGTGPVTTGTPGSGTVTTGSGSGPVTTTGSGSGTISSGSGPVTTIGSGSGTTGSGSGTVTINQGGRITISHGGLPPVGVCPAPPGAPRPLH
jgi:hypothetical protein